LRELPPSGQTVSIRNIERDRTPFDWNPRGEWLSCSSQTPSQPDSAKNKFIYRKKQQHPGIILAEVTSTSQGAEFSRLAVLELLALPFIYPVSMSPVPSLYPWQVLQQRELFDGSPWIKLSVQQIQLPDNRIVDDYYQIALREYAIIFARTVEAQVIVQRQYKHGLGRVSLTLPGGALESEEDPHLAAQRELLEETGYVAETWNSLGSFVVSANYGCGKAHVFTAQNARWVAEPDSGDLEEMEIVLLTPEQVVRAVYQGEIESLGAIAAIALSLNPLFAPDSPINIPTPSA